MTYPPNQVLDFGANVRLIATLCPEATVIGRLAPETVKAELVTLMPETVTVVPPELFRNKTCVCVCPS